MDVNTSTSFRDKWEKNRLAFFAETLRQGSDTQRWILQRNGFACVEDLARHLASKRRILDAGCGNGRVTALLRSITNSATTEIVAVDANSADVARSNLDHYENVSVYRTDLLGDLRELGKFDFIYCQEVLHHTGEPQRAFRNLASILSPGGELAIYVYRQKAPVREFVDDFVRSRIATLAYDDAVRVADQITQLGRVLSEIPGSIKIPAVDILGIEAGEYTVQRFFYHFFMKCYWNADVSDQENVVVNHDWYHPHDCTRHTLPEVRQWYDEAGLTIVHELQDSYGITVRGVCPEDRGV